MMRSPLRSPLRSLSSTCALLCLPALALAQDAAPDPVAVEAALSRAAAKAVETVTPSVVEIEALGGLPPRHRMPANAKQAKKRGILAKKGFKQANGPSTGLIVRKDGLILTSTFILKRKPRHLIVSLSDGRSYVAKLLGRDDGRALALLKVEATDLPVPGFMPDKEIVVGRYSFAVGLGLGLGKPAAASGIVSAKHRIGGKALQSSALISPANYGGPLIGIDGRVMGLLVPLGMKGGRASIDIYDSGIGFAIPADDLLALVPRLERGQVLQAGFLGVVPDPTQTGGGVRVKSVFPGSPAAQAGIKAGDRILQVDGKPTDAMWQLKRALARRNAGDSVKLQVQRQTEVTTRSVRLAPPPRGPFGFPGRPPGPKPPTPEPKPKPKPDGHDHEPGDGHDH